MEYIIRYNQSEILYNELIEKQTEIVKRGVLELKHNLNAIKIQKWYKYWKPFQDFKEEYVEEFRLLINLYRSDRKLSFKQKLSYINILKNAWDEFNKYIPNDNHMHGIEGNRVFVEFLFNSSCWYEGKKDILSKLNNKDFYLIIHPTNGAWHPEIRQLVTHNVLDHFKRKQICCMNQLCNVLKEETNYIFHLYCGTCVNDDYTIKQPHTSYPGMENTCLSYCSTIADFEYTYENLQSHINNLIHIFDNTYFPYLIYKFLKDDKTNIIWKHYNYNYCCQLKIR